MRSMTCVALLLLAAGEAAAQSTWVVDSHNGPGTHFTDLPAAVIAAASGDRLLVVGHGSFNGNYYNAPTIDGKSLTILRQGTTVAEVAGDMIIRNLGPDQSVVLSQLNIGRPSTAANLFLGNNRGLVLLDRVIAGFQGGGYFTSNWVPMIDDSDLVVAQGCDLQSIPIVLPAIAIRRSRLVLLNSQMRALPPFVLNTVEAAIGMEDSTAWVVGSYVEGKWGTAAHPTSKGPGFSVVRSVLYIGPGSEVYGGQTFGGGLRRIGVNDPSLPSPTSSVYRHPAAIVDSAIPFSHHVGPVSTIDASQSGSSLLVIQDTTAGSLTLLAGGCLQTSPWPSVAGPVFLEPTFIPLSHFWIAQGASVQRSIAIPPGLPPGFQIAFQGFELLSGGGLLSSNPLVFRVQ